MEAKRCIYVLVNYAIIVLDNGLSPNQCQAIFWANAALLSTGPWHSNVNAIQNSTILIYKETHLKKIVYKILAIYHWLLTYLSLVPHICVSESGWHWFR